LELAIGFELCMIALIGAATLAPAMQQFGRTE
jgi:hypothetical protein